MTYSDLAQYCTGWIDWLAGWIKWLRADNSQLHTQVQWLSDSLTMLSGKVNDMSDVLDTLKADFEAYQGLVTSTLKTLNDKIAALSNGLDPAKAQAIDDEVKAAIAALTPAPAPAPAPAPEPTPAPTPAPSDTTDDHVRRADQP